LGPTYELAGDYRLICSGFSNTRYDDIRDEWQLR